MDPEGVLRRLTEHTWAGRLRRPGVPVRRPVVRLGRRRPRARRRLPAGRVAGRRGAAGAGLGRSPPAAL